MHAIADDVPDPGFQNRWGHPHPLWMLLVTTVWVNFAFYGFRAFLAPYLAESFFSALPAHLAMQHADLLFSGFSALLYATPLIGGYVADKFLGDRRALWLALLLQTIGLFLMAWPSLAGFEWGAAFYVVSAGLAIPLTVLVGRCYGPKDGRRDAGFTLFYLAINFGAFVAPFICASWIGDVYGYRYGFVAAGIGALLAFLSFHFSQHRFGSVGAAPARYRSPLPMWLAVLGVIVLTVPAYFLLDQPTLLSRGVYVMFALLVLYFLQSGIRSRNRVQLERYVVMLLLFAANIVFWALDLQGATSLNFLARDFVNAPFNFTWFQSANPFYILIIAPFLAQLWTWLDRRNINPSTPRKFGIGIVLVGLSYLVMFAAIHYLQAVNGKVPAWTLALCYLTQTIGELTLSPIGYAMVTRLAAPHETALAMGGWFLSIAMSYDLAGKIATLTTAQASSGIWGYAHVYGQLFWLGIGVGAMYLIAAPLMTRLMHGAR